jgi:hypothetical protein
MATTKWRITRQDKTRYGSTEELKALLIHQLVLVCWRVVPQTISFYNPEPSYLEMPSLHCCMLQRCQVYIVACCNTARSTLLHAAMLLGRHCCTVATLRHGNTTGPCFCVVGSKPWHMVHTAKDAVVPHPPHGIARDQNIILDVPAFGSGMLPHCQMRMVVLEEGVGGSKVEGYWRAPWSRGEPIWGFTNVKLWKVGTERHAPDFQL